MDKVLKLLLQKTPPWLPEASRVNHQERSSYRMEMMSSISSG